MAEAMRAASMGSNAWDRGEGWLKAVLMATGGGAPTAAHKGQSSRWLEADALPSSPCTTSLAEPEAEQTSSMVLGLTAGDATATPMDNTNHTSTRRAIWTVLRSVCMRQILSTKSRNNCPA